MNTRRSFLQTLGIAAAGIAFRPACGWLVPDDIVHYDGAPNLNWLLAESVALLAANLPSEQFKRVAEPTRLAENMHQFGVHVLWPEDLWKLSKEEISNRYLLPAMTQMANEIEFLRPTTCLRLHMIDAVESCARIAAPKNGLELRFVRAWDMGHCLTNEETGEEYFTPPGFIARFDMLVA